MHLSLCVLTGGLWLISYAAILLGHRLQPWICSTCDHQQQIPQPQNKGNLFVRICQSIRRIFLGQSA